MFNKNVELKACTYIPKLLDLDVLTYQEKTFPSWFKKIKNWTELDEVSGIEVKGATIQACPGIRDFMTKPIQIKMWCDVVIKIWPEGLMTYKAAPGADFICGVHGKEQYGDEIYGEDRIAVKFESPWHFFSNSKTEYLMMENHYANNFFRKNGLFSSPGILNFKHQHSTNVHVNFPIKKEPYEIHFKFGQPLISIFPLTEKKIKFSQHAVTKEEFFSSSDVFPSVFTGRYFKKEIK